MGEEQQWPRFELVTYAEPTGIPHGWDRDLITLGVPKSIMGSYKAIDHLDLIEHPTLGPLVRFATIVIRRRGAMCLHPATGSIHYLTGNGPEQEWFVNTTLAQFNESVRAVINRFPFDHGVPDDAPIHDESAQLPASRMDQRDDVDWIIVGEELRELLRRIDPASVADPNGYWSGFVDDVEMGDYSTEAVLHFPGKGGIVAKHSATDRRIHET
jgi:SUKH-4 immunity protein